MEGSQLKVSLLIQGKPSYQWLDMVHKFTVKTSEIVEASTQAVETEKQAKEEVE